MFKPSTFMADSRKARRFRSESKSTTSHWPADGQWDSGNLPRTHVRKHALNGEIY